MALNQASTDFVICHCLKPVIFYKEDLMYKNYFILPISDFAGLMSLWLLNFFLWFFSVIKTLRGR